MRAAYLFQLINLAVSLLMLPVLLSKLSATDYAIWVAFVAFGNGTIQLQNAVQNVAIKDLARGYYSSNVEYFAAARRRTRRAYLSLAGLVLGPVMAGGLIYFDSIGAITSGSQVATAWVIFALAYVVVYVCAPRAALLIGTGLVDRQNNINTFTRVVQLVGVTAALNQGLGLLGLSIAFAAATSIGSLLSALAGRKRAPLPSRRNQGVALADTSPANFMSYIVFSVGSYGIYTGMYLIVVAHVPRDTAASYGLALQISTLLMTIATAPFNVWLGRLTAAVTGGAKNMVVAEVARTFLAANLVFLGGFISLMVLGGPLLHLAGATMRLPNGINLMLFGMAFLVETNIMVLANYLTVRGDFGFAGPYIAGAAVGVALGILAARLTGNPYAFIAMPLVVQACVALPLVLHRARADLGGGAWTLLRAAATIAEEGIKRIYLITQR